MSRKYFATLAILAGFFSSTAWGDGLIYVATQETDNLPELYYINVSNSGGAISATAPIKLSAPQPDGGGVVFGFPNFGNADQVIYGANQDDPDKMEVYIVELASPGVSIKINAELAANEFIDGAVTSPDGANVFYTVRTQIVEGQIETVDLYFVSISNPGVATKVNPELTPGRQVGEFVITPDGTKVIYAAQVNSDAYELFVTELSNPGFVTKADDASSGMNHVIQQLSLSTDGTQAFWVAGSSLPGQNKNLLTVSLSDLGNETQVNEAFAMSGEVVDYDVSPNAATVVYRAKTSPLVASNVYVVNLPGGAGVAAQVNPDWEGGAMLPFFGIESVTLLDNGTVAMYDGPLDEAAISELYETSLSSLGTSTKLNATLGIPEGGISGVSLYLQSFNDALVMYSDGIGGTSGINSVNRSTPGSAVKPFTAGENQLQGLVATFNPDSTLLASVISNIDDEGTLISGELHVADPTINNSNVRVNPILASGFGVIFSFWVPNDAPVVMAPDSDGDGVPDNQDAFPDDPSESVDTDGDGIGNVADEDDDGDTIPDIYETANGLNPLSAADADADLDGDGFSNLEEFLEGTDPQNAADAPAQRKVPIAITILLGDDDK